MAINAKTNLSNITINFDNGDSVVFWYNPNDPMFFERLNKMGSNIQKEIENLELEDFSIGKDGQPIITGEIENLPENEKKKLVDNWLSIIKKVNNIICSEIDKIFFGEASSKIFKYNSPLSMIDDKYYTTIILKDIFTEIYGVLKRQQKEKISKKRKAEKL